MEIIGQSSSILNTKALIQKVAPSNATVLIIGESGTGKELVAKHIHIASKRHQEAFVPINCAAIPSELLESELFGYEKGSFTGANSMRKGRFELANQGTMLLDEIGDMPLMMQVKLLRVLQEKTVERIGGAKSIDVDVRVIAATNKDLEEEVKHGRFREDLFYRLNVFPIYLAPLRKRIEDLPLLIEYFTKQIVSEGGSGFELSNSAMDMLMDYQWPGNIRELNNVMERLALLYPNELISSELLPDIIKGHPKSLIDDKSDIILVNQNQSFNLKDKMDEIEKKYIQQALQATNGVVSHAAKKLGIRRTTLIEKIKKHNMSDKSANVKKLSSSS